MIPWVVLGERPVGTVTAPDVDTASREARLAFGWRVWALEASPTPRTWIAYARSAIGTVTAPDKFTALLRAKATYGNAIVGVQSEASYRVSQETGEAITGRIFVKGKRSTAKTWQPVDAPWSD